MTCQSVFKRCCLQHNIAITCITCPDGEFHRHKLIWYTTAEGHCVDTVVCNIRVISHIQGRICNGPSIDSRPEMSFRMSCPKIDSERSWCGTSHNSEGKAISDTSHIHARGLLRWRNHHWCTIRPSVGIGIMVVTLDHSIANECEATDLLLHSKFMIHILRCV